MSCNSFAGEMGESQSAGQAGSGGAFQENEIAGRNLDRAPAAFWKARLRPAAQRPCSRPIYKLLCARPLSNFGGTARCLGL